MKPAARLLPAAVLMGSVLLCPAQAQGIKAINKNLGYLVQKDPITDVNTSYVILLEVNDLDGNTGLRLRCDDDGKPNVWGSFAGKNEIVPPDPDGTDHHLWPDVIVRLGNDAPFTVPDKDLYSITDDSRSIGFDGTSFDRIVTGLLAGKRVVLRFTGDHLRQPLTYIFSAQGFGSAWQAVKACR